MSATITEAMLKSGIEAFRTCNYDVVWQPDDVDDDIMVMRIYQAMRKLEPKIQRSAAAESMNVDAIEATCIAMAFMIAHFGGCDKFSPYQKKKWEQLRDIHARASSVSIINKGELK